MEIEAIIYGFGWGFLLCFTFGPAFFAIIQISIDNSYKKGAVMALGVVTADAILMFFAVFGTSFLPKIDYFNDIISTTGAILLLVMGFISLFSKKKQLVYPQSTIGSFFYFFVKGAFLNILNPANFLFVVSTCAYLRGALKFELIEIELFFGASLLATLIAEIIIAFYASKVKKMTSHKIITKINQVAGAVFIILAIRMLWKQFA